MTSTHAKPSSRAKDRTCSSESSGRIAETKPSFMRVVSCQSSVVVQRRQSFDDRGAAAQLSQPVTVVADRVRFAVQFHVVSIDKNREGRNMPDAARSVGFEVGEKHVAIPGELFCRTLP